MATERLNTLGKINNASGWIIAILIGHAIGMAFKPVELRDGELKKIAEACYGIERTK